MFEIKEFETNKEKCKVVTENDIKNKIEEFHIDLISITDGEIYNFGEEPINAIYNDLNNPFVVVNDLFNCILTINPTWYLNNQKAANEVINYVARNNKEKKLEIENNFIIDNTLIDSLCNNPNLETVTLAKNKNDNYTLTKEVYLKFKNSSIKCVKTNSITSDLEGNFDALIDYNCHKEIIQGYRYQDLEYFSTIIIKNELTKNDLENIKYLKNLHTLQFTIDTYKQIPILLKRLQTLNMCNKIEIKVNDKEQFNESLKDFEIPKYNNLYVSLDSVTLPITEYQRFEKILYELISPAKEMSPFEKYIFAYNITKKYKKYNENHEDKNKARNLYDILENEYMVCVGFSTMLGDLLTKLGISNTSYSISVDTSYDNIQERDVTVSEQIPTNVGGHSRRMIYLKDEKYNLDGYYVSDPTWDNDLKKDLYNHMVMTHEEMTNTKRYNWFSIYGARELFSARTVEEFYEIAQFILSRNSDLYTIEDLTTLMKSFVQEIEMLDKPFIKELEEKYPYIKEYHWGDIQNLVYDLANYTVQHTNNAIPGETIMAGVRNVYSKAYGYSGEVLEQTMKRIIRQNYENNKMTFPKRFKIDSNDNSIVIMNEENKFDLKEVKKSR